MLRTLAVNSCLDSQKFYVFLSVSEKQWQIQAFLSFRARALPASCAHTSAAENVLDSGTPFQNHRFTTEMGRAYSPTCTHLFMHIDTQVA